MDDHDTHDHWFSVVLCLLIVAFSVVHAVLMPHLTWFSVFHTFKSFFQDGSRWCEVRPKSESQSSLVQ
jgi:hypothetical protein